MKLFALLRVPGGLACIHHTGTRQPLGAFSSMGSGRLEKRTTVVDSHSVPNFVFQTTTMINDAAQ